MLLIALHALAVLLGLCLVLLTRLHSHAGAITTSTLALGYAAMFAVFGLLALLRNGPQAATALLRRSSDDAWRYAVIGLLDYEALFCLVEGIKHVARSRSGIADIAQSIIQLEGRGAAVLSATNIATVVAVWVLSATFLRVSPIHFQAYGLGAVLGASSVLTFAFFGGGYAPCLASTFPYQARGVGLLVLAAFLKATALVGNEWALARRDLHLVLASVAFWALVASLIQGVIVEYHDIRHALYDQQTAVIIGGITAVLFAMHTLQALLLRFTSARSVSYAMLGVPVWWMLLGRAFGLGYFDTLQAFGPLILTVIGYCLHQWHLDQTIGGHGECKKPWVQYYSSAPRATGFGCHVVTAVTKRPHLQPQQSTTGVAEAPKSALQTTSTELVQETAATEQV
jgi:hypothetical protein